MLLSQITLPLLCLAAGSAALPTENAKRDITIIQHSLRNVESATTRLLGSLKAMDPRMSGSEYARSWAQIDRDCHSVSETLTTDANDIRRGPAVSTLEAAALISPINNMETLLGRVVDEWIAVKPAINARDRPTVQKMLKDHQVAASAYADAILSRQSAIASPAGRLLGVQTQNSIQRAVNAYRY
jgi:Hydrophobic surface binding protein A